MILKEIEDFSGYFISDTGQVFCNLRHGARKYNLYDDDLREIRPRFTKHGYARIYIRQDSTQKRKDLYIHRLVAQYFVENPFNYKYVDHKNCIRHDNRAENLEWVSAKENIQRVIKNHHMHRDTLTGRYVSDFKYVLPMV